MPDESKILSNLRCPTCKSSFVSYSHEIGDDHGHRFVMSPCHNEVVWLDGEQKGSTDIPTTADASSYTIAAMWNGYLKAIAATRGPALLISTTDVTNMLQLKSIAEGMTKP